MKKMPAYVTWDESTKAEVFASTNENLNSYDGLMTSTASTRSFINVETNRSVRNGMSYDDYYRFRDGERPPANSKETMSMANQAYKKVGIIKNIIDLMADFGSQGITILHESEAEQQFYRAWWNKVNGPERSERFMNHLFRYANCIIKRREGKVNKVLMRDIAVAVKDDVKVGRLKVRKGYIPCVYDFLNPLMVEVDNPDDAVNGKLKYKMRVSSKMKTIMENRDREQNLSTHFLGGGGMTTLGKNFIPLKEEQLSIYHYKKDDWQVWADPMISAILDDIIMLEKMKLADMSALDGAISNIRLWTVGDLEHKILPTSSTINRLRDILASNVGGGTMDLVWDPTLKFTESNTQIYKFLGDQKYQPVLSSIYAGIGVPPTLTGIAGQSGGFTNNFISLKTLVQRLEYGRGLLVHFWTQEIKRVQKAMGFSKPAVLRFENMILSDEGSEKKLLLDLSDRNIISHQSLCEHFGEKYNIEGTRLIKEETGRDEGLIPPKASPYHDPATEQDHEKELERMDKQGDQQMQLKKEEVKQKKTLEKQNGRPKHAKDNGPRKKRVDNPRSKPGVALIWAIDAQKQISTYLNPPLLAHYGKGTLRSLSKSEAAQMDAIKFEVLQKISPMSVITEGLVLASLKSDQKNNTDMSDFVSELRADFVFELDREPTTDEVRHMQVLSYVEFTQ